MNFTKKRRIEKRKIKKMKKYSENQNLINSNKKYLYTHYIYFNTIQKKNMRE